MGGKTGTTTQSVQIPPEVLARYNSVNATAENAAATPFQQYSTDPSAFVAQLNQQQQTGINNINQQASAAQPAYGAAMQGTSQAYQGYNAPNYQSGVAGYMNPFVKQAMGSTAAYMQNQNQQQQNQLTGNSISQGAFGGDRGKVASAALSGQQNLAMGQTLGQMANQGYQQSVQNYLTGLGQQGALAGQMGALGAGAQTAGLQGAQAQLGAGTLGQQTQQAGNTALYNQFLQQQAYPFQVSQFLANIAEGTGALSGQNTTTTQPMSVFSDERLKQDIEPIGKTFDGQNIIKFRYKGDKGPKQIGLSAQNVEQHHPEAVGLAGGYKTVDYDAATKEAAARGHFYSGGVASEGGAVGFQHEGQRFAVGGSPYDPYDPNSIQNIILRQQTMFANPEASYVPAARSLSGGIGKYSRVPEGNMPVGRLMQGQQAPPLPPGALEQGLGAVKTGQSIAELFQSETNKHDAGALRQFMDFINKKEGTQGNKNSTSTTQGLKPTEDPATAVKPEPPKEVKSGEADPTNTANPGVEKTDLAAAAPADMGLSGAEDVAPVDKFKFSADGGRIYRGLGGGTPEGLYSDEQTGKLNIPDDKSSLKLDTKANLPGAMTDPTMGDIQKIAAMAAAFRANGGRTGYKTLGEVEDPLATAEPVAENNAPQMMAANKAPVAPANDDLSTYLSALGKIESNNNYSALGPQTKRGDRAYGKYQIMGANIPQWTQQALGKQMSADEFLSDKEAQDETAKYHFGKALKQYGNPQDAASVWFTGKPMQKAGDVQDVLGTTAPKYVENFNKAAGLSGGQKTASLQDPNTRTDVPVVDTGMSTMETGDSRPVQVAEDQTSKAAYVPPKIEPVIQEKGLAAGTKSGAYTDESQVVGPLGKMAKKTLGEDFPTSENLWVPLLSGVGTMLSSHSPYLLPALGEGLVGGTSAYMALNKQQPEIAQQLAETKTQNAATDLTNAKVEEVYSGIASDSLHITPQGEMFVRAVGPDGIYHWVRDQDARSAIKAGTLTIDPRTKRLISTVELPAADEKTGLAAGTANPAVKSTPAVVPTPEIKTGVVPPAQQGVVTPGAVSAPVKTGPTELSDEDKKMVKEATDLIGSSGPGFAAKNWGDSLTDYDEDGKAAQLLRPRLLEFAGNISQQPTSGAYTHGTLAPIIQPLANALNSLASTFNFPAPFEKGQQANEEAIDKAVENMSNAAAASGNQRAVSALAHFKATFPTKATSREGAAENTATILQQNQTNADMQSASLNWRNAAAGVDPHIANLTGQQFAEWYLKKNGPMLEQEHQKLKDMMLTPMTTNGKSDGPPIMDSQTKQPMTVMRYIVQMGPNLDDAHKEWFRKNYGDNILRYFPSIKQ